MDLDFELDNKMGNIRDIVTILDQDLEAVYVMKANKRRKLHNQETQLTDFSAHNRSTQTLIALNNQNVIRNIFLFFRMLSRIHHLRLIAGDVK